MPDCSRVLKVNCSNVVFHRRSQPLADAVSRISRSREKTRQCSSSSCPPYSESSRRANMVSFVVNTRANADCLSVRLSLSIGQDGREHLQGTIHRLPEETRHACDEKSNQAKIRPRRESMLTRRQLLLLALFRQTMPCFTSNSVSFSSML